MNPTIREIEMLLAEHGAETYGEGVTQLEHALQAAALAAAEGADDLLVTAALLHDVGHFLQEPDDAFGYHRHDRSGGDWLAQRFPPAVSDPVRLHVAAKRYLCATEPGYFERLSAASVHSLGRQGGPMSPAEAAAFAASPFAMDAVRLRRWDDGGKVDDLAVADLDHYLGTVARVLGSGTSPAS